jgi:hypothetical protein
MSTAGAGSLHEAYDPSLCSNSSDQAQSQECSPISILKVKPIMALFLYFLFSSCLSISLSSDYHITIAVLCLRHVDLHEGDANDCHRVDSTLSQGWFRWAASSLSSHSVVFLALAVLYGEKFESIQNDSCFGLLEMIRMNLFTSDIKTCVPTYGGEKIKIPRT